MLEEFDYTSNYELDYQGYACAIFSAYCYNILFIKVNIFSSFFKSWMASNTRWFNGASQKEHENLSSISNLLESKFPGEDVIREIKRLKTHIETEKNKYDFTFLLSFYLGLQLGIGILLATMTSLFSDLGLYLILLSIFHMWEYTYVSLYHPKTLSYECMLYLFDKICINRHDYL